MDGNTQVTATHPQNCTNLISIENIEITSNEIKKALQHVGLPSSNVFSEPIERVKVFSNLGYIIPEIPESKIGESFYISKFIASTFAGLFDAALNYLWDETIKELRNRVIQYDISYFYDIVLSDSNKRKEFKSEEDLIKLSDRDLLQGAKEIDLLSNIGFHELTHILFMRNWVSAAHPNNYELTGIQLAGFLETCIKHVISLPINNIAIEIKKLLSNIKQNILLDDECVNHIIIGFSTFQPNQLNSLCQGFFSIFTDLSSSEINRKNIKNLLPSLWERVDEETKNKIGLKYGSFSINNETEKKQLAEIFLKHVNGMKYIPEDVKAAKVLSIMNDLITAHETNGNVYTEPSFARELNEIINNTRIPSFVEKDFVNNLIYVFITNGLAEAWNADPYYLQMINNFSENQCIIAVLSINNSDIKKKLTSYPRCSKKFRQLLEILKGKLSDHIAIELTDLMIKFNGNWNFILQDPDIKKKYSSFKLAFNIKDDK